jgi:DNA-binding transcriptional LysR family regulator
VYDVHRLRLLRELSHRGTLAAVAEALGYSPSAISHQLGILERETGATLLEPAGRGVRLTPAAVALVARTEIILRELERAEADIAARSPAPCGSRPSRPPRTPWSSTPSTGSRSGVRSSP